MKKMRSSLDLSRLLAEGFFFFFLASKYFPLHLTVPEGILKLFS